MGVAIIGTVGVPACYGGFETLVDNLLDGPGDYLVYCSSKSYSKRVSTYKGAKLKYIPFSANGISSIPYDAMSMLHAVFSGQKVFLILGVSACLLLPLLRFFTRRRLVVNIDGLEWRRDKWSFFARKFLKFSERMAVRFAHVVIADNEGIANYVQDEYGVKAKVIAYGGDHVLIRPFGKKVEGYAFSVCRVEPENNVHVILKAFDKSKMNIKFVGNWAASTYGLELKTKYLNSPNIELIDPVYDLNLLFEYRDRCSLYVHGHSAGGTNPSLVEAMFFGKPIVAFDCVYNRATTDNAAVYFSNVYELEDILSSSADANWRECGHAMRAVAEKRYTWKAVRNDYIDLL